MNVLAMVSISIVTALMLIGCVVAAIFMIRALIFGDNARAALAVAFASPILVGITVGLFHTISIVEGAVG